jgi:MFS family permease
LIIVFGTNYSFGIFFNRLLDDLGWSRTVTSTGYSIAQLFGGYMGIVTGRLCDRFGPRFVALGCGVCLMAGAFIMSHITQPWQFYIIYGFLMGVGFGGAVIPLASTISRWFTKKRGLMTGIAYAGIGTGTMIYPLFVNPLLTAVDWRMSFVYLGILAMVVIIPASLFLKRDPGEIGAVPYGAETGVQVVGQGKETGLTFKRAIRTSQFWTVFFVYLFSGYCIQTIIVHIVPQAKALNLDAAGAALIMTFLGLGSILGRIVVGSASDRIGVKYALMVSTGAVVIAFLWLFQADALWKFYIFAVVYGFGYGGLIAMQTLSMANMFGLVSLGTMVGLITSVYTTGGGVGPIITGYIFDVTESYRLAFIICTGLAISALALTLLMRPLRAKERR